MHKIKDDEYRKQKFKVQTIHILDPGFSTSLTMWVIPALLPKKAVRCGGLLGSSLGKAFTAWYQKIEHNKWACYNFLGKKLFIQVTVLIITQTHSGFNWDLEGTNN